MKAIIKKMHDIQKMNLRVKKTEDNPFFKSKYVPLEAIQDILHPIVIEKGLVVFHRVRDRELVTTVVDVDTAEALESAFPISEGIKPQEVGSAITYGKRYNLGALFNIITDDDDDGNGSSQPPKTSKVVRNLPAEDFGV